MSSSVERDDERRVDAVKRLLHREDCVLDCMAFVTFIQRSRKSCQFTDDTDRSSVSMTFVVAPLLFASIRPAHGCLCAPGRRPCFAVSSRYGQIPLRRLPRNFPGRENVR